MSEDTTSRLASYLSDNPRLMGAVPLLLSEAGGVAAAGNGGVTSGP
ncbi:MAG: hypothetical protein ABEH40_03760 [Haloferacaceae archaeon]